MSEVCELAQFRRDRACQTTAGEVQAPQVSELADPSRNLASEVLIAQIQHTLVCDAVKHLLGYRLVHWLARFAVAHDGLSVCGLGYRSRQVSAHVARRADVAIPIAPYPSAR